MRVDVTHLVGSDACVTQRCRDAAGGAGAGRVGGGDVVGVRGQPRPGEVAVNAGTTRFGVKRDTLELSGPWTYHGEKLTFTIRLARLK